MHSSFAPGAMALPEEMLPPEGPRGRAGVLRATPWTWRTMLSHGSAEFTKEPR